MRLRLSLTLAEGGIKRSPECKALLSAIGACLDEEMEPGARAKLASYGNGIQDPGGRGGRWVQAILSELKAEEALYLRLPFGLTGVLMPPLSLVLKILLPLSLSIAWQQAVLMVSHKTKPEGLQRLGLCASVCHQVSAEWEPGISSET